MANDASLPIAAPAGAAAEDGDWMQSISGQIQFLSPGDRAGLRRMDLARRHATDGIVIKLLTRAKVPDARQRADFARWRLIAHVAGVLSGTGAVRAHAERERLGERLHAARYSENRLLRLLAVRGAALHDQVRLAARMLAQQGKQPVDLWKLYHLLSDDAAKAERARIRIAQDYYAAAARSAQGAESDD